MGRGKTYAILALLLVAQVAVSAPTELSFKVTVTDPWGQPVEGALVVLINARTLGAAYIGKTDPSGRLEGSVPSGEYYLLYMIKVEEGRLTHLPIKVDLTSYPRAQNLEIRALLYPAARINVTGRIVYIGEAYAGRVRVQILDRYGVPLSKSLSGGEVVVQYNDKVTRLNATIVDLYGATLDYTALKRGLGYPPLREMEALAPIGYPVIARVNYLLVMLREATLRDLSIDFGSFANPLVLSSSEDVFTIDLLKTSLEGQIGSVKRDLDSARALIHNFEALGFYIPEVIDLLKRGEEYVSAAEERFARGARPEEILALLEAGSTLANDQIPKRLGFIRDVAKVGAVVMPSFIAVFAAVLAFYFFEKERAKIVGFSLIYALFVAAFAYLYPGFRLLWSLDRSLFLSTVGGAYALFVAIVFALPKIIKEPELPSEIALGGLIAIAFTLGKRYSKIRLFRTSIMIFSIAAFIWAFTVLATFGTVYTKIEEKEFATYPENVLMIKRVVDGVPQPLNPDLDTLLFEGRKDVARPYFVVYNRPDESLEIIVSYAGLERVVHFAVGIDREEFRLNPLLPKAVTLYRAFDNGSVILPSSIWTSLGLKGGEPVYILVRGERLQLRAAGYFNESLINEWKGPDGSPIRPFVIREGKPVYANSSDFLIAHYSLLMRLLPQFEGGYSSVFLPYQISAEPLSDEQGWLFANEVVDRRGESYIAITCYGGKCSRVYYGTRVESIFQQEATFLVPLAIVIINVLMSMLSIVRERKREIYIFMTVGFNPRHIALVFLAEAIIYGLLSGGFGYVAGLTTFRALSIFAQEQNLMVREKIEWYWSYIAIALAVAVSVIGAIKPSMDAAYLYAPTEIRRRRIAERREKAKREEFYLKTGAAKTFSIPGEILADEAEAAFSYIYSKLAELSYGELESVENLQDLPMEIRSDGTRIKRFQFNYISTTESGLKVTMGCELRFLLSPGAEAYRVELDSKPVGHAPISHMDYAADLAKRIVSDWIREREKLLQPG